MGYRYQLFVVSRWRARTLEFSPRHARVTQEYAAGKDLTEIAREEEIKPRNYLRILRTAPFRLLECGGIIGPRELKLPRRVLHGRE